MKFGPAGEAPSRLQRALNGADPKISSCVFGTLLSLFILGFAVVRRAGQVSLAQVLALSVLSSVLGSVAFHRLRSDRKATREERLQTVVAYVPAFPTLKRPLAYWTVISLSLGLMLIGLVATARGITQNGPSGWALLNLVAYAAVIAMGIGIIRLALKARRR